MDINTFIHLGGEEVGLVADADRASSLTSDCNKFWQASNEEGFENCEEEEEEDEEEEERKL